MTEISRMTHHEVTAALEHLRAAESEWLTARAKYNSDSEALLSALLLRGLEVRLSPEDIGRASGIGATAMRRRVRALGLNTRRGAAALSREASETLRENAALLGIAPEDVDLLSPLAYLPAGPALRMFPETSVTEDDIEEFRKAWMQADQESGAGTRIRAGLAAVFKKRGIR